MPPDSGGNYIRTDGTRTGSTVCQQAKAAGVNDLASLADAREQDLATALNNRLFRDGTNTPTANLPMGGLKHTGVGSATGSGQYVEYAQMNTAIATSAALQVAKDGSVALTGNLPMGSHKLTGLVAGSTSGDSIEFDQMNTAIVASFNPANISTPATPLAGTVKIYAKTNYLASLDSSGVERLIGKAPTSQGFFSGSGTVTPTAGTTIWRARIVGGGGGGGGISGGATNGSSGGTTTLGGWSAVGGGGGASGPGGAGGSGGTGGTTGVGAAAWRVAGQAGSSGAGGYAISGHGGWAYTSSGGHSQMNGSSAGLSASGNGGGGSGGSFTVSSAAGGGGAEYVEFWVQNPSAVSYSVGTYGSAGAGTFTGGTGSGGFILIDEFYS